jgi:hypothetical protein
MSMKAESFRPSECMNWNARNVIQQHYVAQQFLATSSQFVSQANDSIKYAQNDSSKS